MSEAIRGLVAALQSGERRALSRAITLVESRRADHRQQALALLRELSPARKRRKPAARIAITGAPGTGKSTLINALGRRLLAAGKRVAVLAIDPTSARTGGSLLGDKTRMADLAASEAAFVRPSPASGVLGGVALRTRETLLLCEAAGYDPVLIETVGVGQSEFGVAHLVDTTVIVGAAGAGDEVQAIKRGLIEEGDVFVINKADGEGRARAELAAQDLQRASNWLRPKLRGWKPPVLLTSASESSGIAELWQGVEEHRAHLEVEVGLSKARSQQARLWFIEEVEREALRRFREQPNVAHQLERMGEAVQRGELEVTEAVERVFSAERTLSRHG